MIYKTPAKDYFRIHHIRPRFKNDVESVLVSVATEINQLPKMREEEFKEKLNLSIRRYPGNLHKEEKTINNWRTEISSLFGLIQYDSEAGEAWPGTMAKTLAENQDLIEFFKYFLYYFQYPGGHLKSHQIAEFVKAGVKFKPVQYLLEVLKEAEKITGARFGINKAEATHCIFNDLRVTRDSRAPSESAKLITENRKKGARYDWSGDVVRYAGDILDYMVLADLLVSHPDNRYYINEINLETISAFLESREWFDGYERFYGERGFEVSDIESKRDAWFVFVNRKLSSDIFETDVLKFLEKPEERVPLLVQKVIEEFRREITAEGGARTKDIGDFGESLMHKHERERLKQNGRPDLVGLIKRIPTSYALGYDIKSVELNEKQRHIEVKSTLSRSKIKVNKFHMTSNEWRAAETYDGSYFVYRLLISKDEIQLYVINDPVGKYKEGLLEMIPKNGADITFSGKSGRWEKVLV